MVIRRNLWLASEGDPVDDGSRKYGFIVLAKLVQKVDRTAEDGESYLNFKCSLRRQHSRI